MSRTNRLSFDFKMNSIYTVSHSQNHIALSQLSKQFTPKFSAHPKRLYRLSILYGQSLHILALVRTRKYIN